MVKMISILLTDHLNQADPESPVQTYRYILLTVKSGLFVLFCPHKVIWTTVLYHIHCILWLWPKYTVYLGLARTFDQKLGTFSKRN